MLLPVNEKVPNPKFGVVISKTMTCRSWTHKITYIQDYKHTNSHGSPEDERRDREDADGGEAGGGGGKRGRKGRGQSISIPNHFVI